MWIGIARVKNEEDVIEAFVRHSSYHFDHLVIVDHASTDRTPEILQSLIDEGLSLEVQRSAVFEPQGVALTRLMHHAFLHLGADWVVPLDADEFMEVADGARLRERVQDSGKNTVEIAWNNFMYVPGLIDDPDPIRRMRWRSREPSELPKVVIPRAVGVDPRVVIYEGSHFVARNGVITRGQPVDDLVLCHFPIRSLEQYRLKVIFGTLRYIINASPDEHIWGWHYREAYDLIVNDRLKDLENLMRRDSLKYSANNGSENILEKCLERYGGDLRYTSAVANISPIANLTRFAENIAKSLAAEKQPDRWLKRLKHLFKP